ncbi:peroxiredoxin-like family protein [Cohnella sp. GCM10027633]|uniref:peroxiredoxin-like family protein n=1 Tax=unclassified Cohnella TaxID=2636738 RepID=UPI00363F7121
MSHVRLEEQLADAKNQFTASTPVEALELLERSLRELQDSGNYPGVSIGEKVKDFTATDALGNKVSLYEELSKGPVVLVFYRGSWCPFCNLQLKAYQRILPQIHAVGAQLIAISPQSPDNSLTIIEKQNLSYKVLSDNNGLAAAKYNILYEVPDYLQHMLESVGLNLAEYNSTNRWILPVPATFMIDESAIVRSAYVNPNFMQRMEPADILYELQKL